MTSWTVPGSVLLAGEYRITENGGSGIAAAAGGRAKLQYLDPLAPLSMECREHEDRCCLWRPFESTEQNASIIGQVYKMLGAPSVSGRVILDTSAFYNPYGHKQGLGSSAAAAVLAAHFLGQSMDIPPLETAIKAHRAAQGGQGSGYDVCTSYYGGAGLFTGGPQPEWLSFSWPDELKAVLLRGPRLVRTASALSRYTQWAAECPGNAADWRRQMDQAVTELHNLLSAGKLLDEMFTAFNNAGRSGLDLGNVIGVPARPHIPSGLGRDIADGFRQGAGIKCVGAGDELTLLLYREGALLKTELNLIDGLIRQRDAFALEVEREGLCLE